MPTLALSNTVAFTNIDDRNKFPALRVWGTIGWIVAGLIVGGLGMSSSPKIFTLGAVSGIVLGVLCFFMPKTPPPGKGKPVNLSTLLMVDAFKMLCNVPFLIFIICSAMICVPLAYYFAYTSVYLPQIGFQAPASTMALGQVSEIFFMLLVPFFFRKLGVKIMILIGMLAWVARYALFAIGRTGSGGLDDYARRGVARHLLRLFLCYRVHVYGPNEHPRRFAVRRRLCLCSSLRALECSSVTK